MWKWKCHLLSHVPLFATLGSFVHGILQARILEWYAIPFSRGSARPRDQTWVFCIAARFFTSWATRELNCILKVVKRVDFTYAYTSPQDKIKTDWNGNWIFSVPNIRGQWATHCWLCVNPLKSFHTHVPPPSLSGTGWDGTASRALIGRA